LFQTVLARPSVQGVPPNLVLAGVVPMTVSDRVPPYLVLERVVPLTASDKSPPYLVFARWVRFAISC